MSIWLLGIRLLIIALSLRRLAVDSIKVRRHEIPGTRLIIPVAIVTLALLVANRSVPRAAAVTGLSALDLVLLGLCFWFLKALWQSADEPVLPERRLESVLTRFFPRWFACLVSADITVLSHALVGLRTFINPGRSDARSYVHGSKISIVAIVVAVSIVPDAILFGLLLPHKLWWLAIVLTALDIWACLWFFGLYGTMVRRPHDWSHEKIVFNNGILQTVEVDPNDIADAHVIGAIKRHRLPRRRGDDSVVLGFGGVRLVAIVLKKPALERHLFRSKPRQVRRLFVSSDVPDT